MRPSTRAGGWDREALLLALLHCLDMGDPGRHRFTFMLDGVGDPRVARDLTRDLHAQLGLVARADPAGMWLEIESKTPVDEAMSDRVAEIARRHALEPRDRISTSFVSGVTAEQLRARLSHEWTSRWATGLVFLLPAVVLHYLTPVLAQGGRLIPGMIEASLVIWSLIAACWPIVWQGLLAARCRRFSPDLFTLTALLIPLLAGVVQVVIASENVLHITAYVVVAATTQRMILWRRAARLQGSAHLMPPSSPLLALVLLGGLVTACFDFRGGMAMLLAMPAMIGLSSINRLMHPIGAMIPPVLMSALIGAAPLFLSDAQLAGRVEAAFAFNVLLSLVYGAALGARRPASAAATL